MRQQLTRMLSQIERLEVRTAEIQEGIPSWAMEGTVGHDMIVSHLRDLASRVSQAGDPTWFRPNEFTEAAWHEATVFGWEMIDSGGYGEAFVLGVQELQKWPKYQSPKLVEQIA